MDINTAKVPAGYEADLVICPNCEFRFTKADRCPECGQLIAYDEDELNIDFAKMLEELNACGIKKELHEIMNKYGFRSFGENTTTENPNDLYYQFADGSRIHFQKTQISFRTCEKYRKLYFSRYESTFVKSKDGNYRTERTKVDKNPEELAFLLRFFWKDKRNRLKRSENFQNSPVNQEQLLKILTDEFAGYVLEKPKGKNNSVDIRSSGEKVMAFRINGKRLKYAYSLMCKKEIKAETPEGVFYQYENWGLPNHYQSDDFNALINIAKQY